MSNELPDLDEDASFVVDDGAPTGPIPLRTIIDSIRSGERAPDVLVWWAGAPEWEQFASNPSLFSLLQDLPATNQPAPPPDHNEETVLPEETAVPEETEVSEDTAVHEHDEETVLPEETAVPEETEVSEDTAVHEDIEVHEHAALYEEAVVDEEAWVLDVEVAGPDADAELEEAHLGEEAAPAAAADAEAHVLLARDSRAMHPSSRWGLDVPATESTAPKSFATEFDVPKFDEPAAEIPQETIESEPAKPDPSLTGLFSASARTDAGLSGETATTSTADVATSARLSLENVGARIDALTSATRQARRSDVDHLDEAQAIEPESVTIEEPLDVDADESVDVSSDVDAEEPAPSAGSWQAVAELSDVVEIEEPAADLGDRFAEMVRKSVEHQLRLDWATRVDELLLSACITAIVDSGYLLLETTSNDSDHRVLFDHNDDSRQVRLELAPLSPLNAAGDHVGRHVRVGLAWGRAVADGDEASALVSAEATDGDVAPGTFSCEVNMVADSASTKVGLIWAADEFVRDDHSVDRPSLDASIAAVLHALEVRWYELFEPAR